MAYQTVTKIYTYTKDLTYVQLRTTTDEGAKLTEAEYELCVEGDYFKLDPKQFLNLVDCISDLRLVHSTCDIADRWEADRKGGSK